jgi:hypothetical protein
MGGAMAFRGNAPANSTVKVKLSADLGNSGNAFLMVGAGPFGSNPTGDAIVVAPGASDSLTISTPASGILKVTVDFSDSDDSGHLEVTGPQGFRDGDPIQGDPTTWVYSV